MKILVFTDAHDIPEDVDKTRFHYLGQFIVKHKPDVIVQLGDFMTLDSLSHWNKNKRGKLEGKRYRLEVESARRAVQYIVGPYRWENTVRKQKHTKQYRPQWYWFEGNHEGWISKYLDSNPELAGTIYLKENLNVEGIVGYPVNYYPYPHVQEIAGLFFTHAPHNKGGAISSKYVADKTLDFYSKSVIFGHNHRLLVSSRYRFGDDMAQYALSCGCYFPGLPEYAEGTAQDYWRGIILLDAPGDGTFTFSTHNMKGD